ncbi:ArsC family transcriptional regulator [Cetobacterium sp. 8H]|uniref:arsenate reductase family protein n=1 Tax=Cetobacterium sp. 8H TaxID=2759681 RepID=UPI00163D3602|nr:ArsC/Spx/MgsR family protein [Cetobacterium sp. 8H]MBC2850682.1 ArsC family transcriptional regulator [Cetobacterium sp. 8H]
MIIQIFGKKSCNDTKKAQRYFKERGIKTQFINLLEKGISEGELKVITKEFDLEMLLDIDGNEYKKRNLKYMVYDVKELLCEHPILYKTPIVRFKSEVTLGNQPEIWKNWEIK